MREGMCYRPSMGLAEELAMASVKKALSSWGQWRGETQSYDDGIKAATSRGGRWRCFPPLLRSLRSDWVMSVGYRGYDEPRTASRRPPPIYIAQCDGGPPTM